MVYSPTVLEIFLGDFKKNSLQLKQMWHFEIHIGDTHWNVVVLINKNSIIACVNMTEIRKKCFLRGITRDFHHNMSETTDFRVANTM